MRQLRNPSFVAVVSSPAASAAASSPIFYSDRRRRRQKGYTARAVTSAVAVVADVLSRVVHVAVLLPLVFVIPCCRFDEVGSAFERANERLAATSSTSATFDGVERHRDDDDGNVDRTGPSATLNDWCQFDSGPATITGSDVDAYVSVTRDGSVWLRLGAGGGTAQFDWSMVDRRRPRLQTPVLDDDTIEVIRSVRYVDYCVLTDVELKLTVQAGWNPSYLTFYDPQQSDIKIVSLKKVRDCFINTSLSLSADKQGLRCDGGRRSSCGVRNAPDVGQATPTWFLKYVSMDLDGPDRWYCPIGGSERDDDKDVLLADHDARRRPIAPSGAAVGTGGGIHWSAGRSAPVNMYTFVGSYYHVYIKLASCDPPKDSRSIGHEIRLRSRNDDVINRVVIPTPTQTVIAAGQIESWQLFVTAASVQHSVYLQVWRPIGSSSPYTKPVSADDDQTKDITTSFKYKLIGQTYVSQTSLRRQEVRLSPPNRIAVERGDVLGFYHPGNNPLGWTSIPCPTTVGGGGNPRYRYRFAVGPSSASPPGSGNAVGVLVPGDVVEFTSASPISEGPCRQYSIAALFANKSSDVKTVEDWTCPSESVTKAAPSSSSFNRRDSSEYGENDPPSYSTDVRPRAAELDTSRMLQKGRRVTDKKSSTNSYQVVPVDGARFADMDSLPVHIALIVAGSLLLTMIVVGLISYYRAVQS